MRKLAAETLKGYRDGTGYTDKNMEKGIEIEPEARKHYEARFDCKVEQVGFVKQSEWVGGSPDGLVGEDGLVEIKCPLSSTHINTTLRKKMDTNHVPQVQGLLWITERLWCDFVSYDPEMLTRPMFCVRVIRNVDYIKNKLAPAVGAFVNELKVIIDEMDSKF